MTERMPASQRQASVRRAVAMFALTGLVALVVLAAGSIVASRHASTDTAIRDARRDAAVVARAAVQPEISNALLVGDPNAIARLDRDIRSRVLDHDLVRVKVWRVDGRILYSDEARLVGTTYALADDEQEAFRTGAAAADVSDLTRPENRYERPFGKLLEVYQPVHTPNGTRLLFEAYFRYDAVTAGSRRVWDNFAPIMLGALVGLEALQIPLAWSMARRLQSGQLREARLLRSAIEASDAERRRIASDLHDGVVQDLAGVSYLLGSIDGDVQGASRDALRDAAEGTRHSIRLLRSLLIEIYPPSLRDAGLRAALSDLAALLSAHGVVSNVDLPDELVLSDDVEALLYRTAQEAVRNVVAHARAHHVEIRVSVADHSVVLEVVDDGVGFDPADVTAHAMPGHFGLRVLGDLARDAGGRAEVTSRPGEGTRVHVEVPTR